VRKKKKAAVEEKAARGIYHKLIYSGEDSEWKEFTRSERVLQEKTMEG